MNADDKRYAELLAKHARCGLTVAETSEYRGLIAEGCANVAQALNRNRIPWGNPGSKVARKTEAHVTSRGKSRKVVVSVYPDGRVGYRLLGERTEFYRNAAGDYAEAAMITKRAERAAKRKARQAK